MARQYLRSGAYTQAIDALRGALARMNDRLDLKRMSATYPDEIHIEVDRAEDLIRPDCLGVLLPRDRIAPGASAIPDEKCHRVLAAGAQQKA